MLISGGKCKDNAPFRVVIGHGAWIMPFFRKVKFLTLAIQESQVTERCVTTQGIELTVQAIIAFKVGDDPGSIVLAGTRFLSEQSEMEQLVAKIFAGHLRSIIGSMTVEEIIRERQKLASEVFDASKLELSGIGLVVDSFQIQSVDDGNIGYIKALSAPHVANVQRDAEIAQAEAAQAAAEREQESQRKQAEYARETAIAKAQYQAETDKAQAEAAQAGPLAQAEAEQKVIDMRAQLAERTAALRERELQTEVIKPAEAEAQRVKISADAQTAAAESAAKTAAFEADAAAVRRVKEAEAQAKVIKATAAANAEAANANAEAVKAQGRADAEVTRVAGEAKADAIKAEGLAVAAGDLAKSQAVAAENGAQLELARIQVQPEIARALAEGIGLKDANVTVFNGAEGLTQLVAGVMPLVQSVMGRLGGNGESTKVAPISGEQPDIPAPQPAGRR
uniref:flotillin family protein n=1 Tax=Mycobacterium intracellulare TaxID=1767 RepID=UPI00398A685B